MKPPTLEEALREVHGAVRCLVTLAEHEIPNGPSGFYAQAEHLDAAIDWLVKVARLEQAERDVLLLTEEGKGHMMRMLEERDRLWREAGGDDGK